MRSQKEYNGRISEHQLAPAVESYLLVSMMGSGLKEALDYTHNHYLRFNTMMSALIVMMEGRAMLDIA